MVGNLNENLTRYQDLLDANRKSSVNKLSPSVRSHDSVRYVYIHALQRRSAVVVFTLLIRKSHVCACEFKIPHNYEISTYGHYQLFLVFLFCFCLFPKYSKQRETKYEQLLNVRSILTRCDPFFEDPC